MNHFFYESRANERVRDAIEEGMRSQAVHKSGSAKAGIRLDMPKLLLSILGIIGLLAVLIR